MKKRNHIQELRDALSAKSKEWYTLYEENKALKRRLMAIYVISEED